MASSDDVWAARELLARRAIEAVALGLEATANVARTNASAAVVHEYEQAARLVRDLAERDYARHSIVAHLESCEPIEPPASESRASDPGARALGYVNLLQLVAQITEGAVCLNSPRGKSLERVADAIRGLHVAAATVHNVLLSLETGPRAPRGLLALRADGTKPAGITSGYQTAEWSEKEAEAAHGAELAKAREEARRAQDDTWRARGRQLIDTYSYEAPSWGRDAAIAAIGRMLATKKGGG